MIPQMLVIPFKPELIERLHQQLLVIRADNYDQIMDIMRVGNRGNRVHSILLSPKEPFGVIPFKEEWKNIPLIIFSNEMGYFKDVAIRLRVIRQLKIRVFLNSDHKNVYTNLRILASLGVPCGIHFGDEPVMWEAMNDLMTYSVYGKAKHATIEPFQYLVTQYKTQEQIDFSGVYFDNPEQCFHVNEDGKVALTRSDYENNNFVTEKLEELASVKDRPAFIERKTDWQKFFLNTTVCASCPGWRVCLGKFSTQAETDIGCRQFFADMMDAADYYRMKHQQEQEVWR